MTTKANIQSLKEWAAAEKAALAAEELLRTAYRAHIDKGLPIPSMEMQDRASMLRASADVLYAALYLDIKSRNDKEDGVSGS
jgi:hypothetical protein